MSRIARIVIPGLAHHVTQRGNNRQTVFEEDCDYLRYCYWLNKYALLNELEILAYCLMPNHVHFIVVPKDAQSISRTFQLTHMCYAQYINDKKATSGHLWQGRFYSCAMDERHLYQALKYVERNPVRTQSVKNAWDYAWSSAGWHIGSSQKSNIFLTKTNIAGQGNWKEYLVEEDDKFDKNLRAKTRKGLAVGDSEFIQKMEDKTGRLIHREKVGRKGKS